jgi:phage terminase large subunit GpA-like protein
MDRTRAEPARAVWRPGVEVPAPVPVLTAGVDVQEDRFELQVIAWGPGDERWVVDWRSIPGNPKDPRRAPALLEALGRVATHTSGHQLPIHATCIDSGFATDEVYDFVLAHQARRIYATKGFAGRSGEPIVGKPSEKRTGDRRGRSVCIRSTSTTRRPTSSSSLALLEPGPGSTHFPLHVDTMTRSTSRSSARSIGRRGTTSWASRRIWSGCRSRTQRGARHRSAVPRRGAAGASVA